MMTDQEKAGRETSDVERLSAYREGSADRLDAIAIIEAEIDLVVQQKKARAERRAANPFFKVLRKLRAALSLKS